jgi:phage gpG-like protein
MAETRITIEVPGTAEMQAKLAAKPALVRRTVIRALRLSGEAVYARALDNVSGKVLRVQTGTLRRRLHTSPVDEQLLRVVVSDPVKYAPVHEYGGTFTVPQHQRRIFARGPRGGRLTGKKRTVRAFVTVRSHTATYPARPFMRPALQDSAEDIHRIFVRSLGEALQEAQ